MSTVGISCSTPGVAATDWATTLATVPGSGTGGVKSVPARGSSCPVRGGESRAGHPRCGARTVVAGTVGAQDTVGASLDCPRCPPVRPARTP